MMDTNNIGQNDQYWEKFLIGSPDIEHLMNFLVDGECPQTLDALTYELMHYRHQQMIDLLKDVMAQGRVYRPSESYSVGDNIIFPHLNNVVGEVTHIRPGHNPEYDTFSVIRVRIKEGDEREFAAGLTSAPPLNTVSYSPAEQINLDDLYERYSTKIKANLKSNLEKNVQFMTVGEQWFLRDLVIHISPGQLNIAEALLDMSGGGPVATDAFLDEMDLPAEISKELQAFSLEYALLRDNRFDEVGAAGKGVWYLRRMEPREGLETPPALRYLPIPYNRGLLDETMLALERQIDDEWSETAYTEPQESAITLVLTYPHWRSGTLPLASRIAKLFPTAKVTDRIRFTFVDESTKEEFPGWVVRSGRYVYGLAEWYEKNQIGAGAFIDIRPGSHSGEMLINARRIRSRRREWLRTVTSEDNQLTFEVDRVPIACEFDELAAIAVADPGTIDVLAEKLQKMSLETLLDQVFNGLAGLSLQRAVHALTLYCVLNLVKRITPGPVLTMLAASPKYVSLGDNYWAYRGDET